MRYLGLPCGPFTLSRIFAEPALSQLIVLPVVGTGNPLHSQLFEFAKLRSGHVSSKLPAIHKAAGDR